MIFSHLSLPFHPKMGGTETLPSETWIGLNADGQWVRADGVDVPAVMFLKSVGRPGELADAVRSCIVMDPTANLVPGTKQFCGPQVVGYTLDHQSILMEAHDVPSSPPPRRTK